MAEYNPIKIDGFSEVTDLLSSDKIIVFEQTRGNLSPHLYDVAELSAFAIFPTNIDDIKNKVNAVKADITEAINYLQRNFIAKSDAATLYATVASLNDTMKKLETVTSFMNRVANKGEQEYLDYLYNKVRNDCARSKARLGDGAWRSGGERGKGYKVIAAARAGKKME